MMPDQIRYDLTKELKKRMEIPIILPLQKVRLKVE